MPRPRLRPPLLLLALAACHSTPAIPKSPVARQHVLGERILVALAHAKSESPSARSDLGLALGALVLPTQAPRLRLAVAGDDPSLAAGAAVALARITSRRDGQLGLLDCARHDTNSFVRAACGAKLRQVAPSLALKLPPPPAAPSAPLPSARDVSTLLESGQPRQRRAALRLLLTVPGADRRGDARLQRDLVDALGDADAQVALLASALFLRRSLALSPPPVDAALPDPRAP